MSWESLWANEVAQAVALETDRQICMLVMSPSQFEEFRKADDFKTIHDNPLTYIGATQNGKDVLSQRAEE